jgi:N-acetyl sugar amidotransferase
MIESDYQVCTRCVMDTSDPEIEFNSNGVCNHCIEFDEITSKFWYPNKIGKKKLEKIFEKIKSEGRRNEYDCIIGLSGGVDSSYLALAIKDCGLRPLVVHVDCGWNTELAVHNIEQVVKYCDYELHTHVMDWKEIRDLQVAYLNAGIANQDAVQDHAFFASLYHFAVKNNINYVISGGNIATESVFVKSWHHSAMDSINLKSIHKKYGNVKLQQYKTINFLAYFLYYPFVKNMSVIRPLNFMPFNKGEALEILKEKIGYKEYGRKHGESLFTKFFQNYYLPKKFNMDKRKLHLSSQILSGELSRENALKELKNPLYDPSELLDDCLYISKKLGLSVDELNAMIDSPGRSYSEFSNWDNYYKFMKFVKYVVEKILKRNVKKYS